MPGLFVTGTGTEVGKTYLTAGLVRACRRSGLPAAAFKPVLSGFDPDDLAGSDAGRLLLAMGQPATAEAVAEISPWRFAAPLSPHMAAALEGREIGFDDVVAACRAATARGPLTFVEGVGGVMVPLDGRRTVLDLMARLLLPVVLVAGTGLGSISHCLTAVTALASRGLAPELIVLTESTRSHVPLEALVETIRSFCPGTIVALLGHAAPEERFDDLLVRLRPALR